MIGFSSYDDWKTTPPPEEGDASLCSKCGEWSEWEDSQCPRCGYGEPPSYACDGCGDMLPQSELHHVRSTSGETDQCARCLGMDGDAECEARR